MKTSARCAPSAWIARRTASVRCRRSTASHACSSVGGISGALPAVPTPPALLVVAARRRDRSQPPCVQVTACIADR